MAEQNENEKNEVNQQRQPEPVKSTSTRLQETMDQQAAKKAERERLTAGVQAKREQADSTEPFFEEPEPKPDLGPLQPGPEQPGPEQPGPEQPGPEQPEPESLDDKMLEAFNFIEAINKSRKDSELREIEMHNSGMDMNVQIVSAMHNIDQSLQLLCGLTARIVNKIKE